MPQAPDLNVIEVTRNKKEAEKPATDWLETVTTAVTAVGKLVEGVGLVLRGITQVRDSGRTLRQMRD